MAANQSIPGLNSGLLSKFELLGKYTTQEIYRRMCNMYREASFSQKTYL